MPKHLTRPPPSAKNLASKIASAPSLSGFKGPKFALVYRSRIASEQFNSLELVVDAVDRYRRHRGDSDSDLGEWLGVHRTTIYRARESLAENYGPYQAKLNRKGKESFLYVLLEEVREHGALAAMFLAELRGWGGRDDRKPFGGRGGHVITARELSAGIGCCLETITALLRRLRGLVETVWARGAARVLRLLNEREQFAPEPEIRVAPEPKDKPPAREPPPPSSARFFDIVNRAMAP